MASFRKRSGRWQARIPRRGFEPIVKTFDLKSDAERWAIAVQRELDLGEYSPKTDSENITVSELIDRYLRDVVPLFRGADREKYTLNNLRSQLGKLSLKGLTPMAVAAYRDTRARLVSSSTVLREINSLSAMLNHAKKEWGMAITNPVGDVRKPKPNQARNRRLEGDEEARRMEALEPMGRRANGQLLGGTRNHWIKPMVKLALATAMRRGELLALEWRFVDLEKRVAHLPMTKNGFARNVPLSTAACGVLSSLPRSISGKVFPITADAFKRAFTRACEKARIVDLHFHDLRHEATSRMANRLPNVIELAAVTGHLDLKMLQRYYHTRPEELASKLG